MYQYSVGENGEDIVEKDSELRSIRKWADDVKAAILKKGKAEFRRNKLMMIGNGGAGKTSTLKSLLGLKFSKKYNSTLVADNDQQIELYTGNIVNWKQVKQKTGQQLLQDDFASVLQYASKEGRIRSKSRTPQEMVVESTRESRGTELTSYDAEITTEASIPSIVNSTNFVDILYNINKEADKISSRGWRFRRRVKAPIRTKIPERIFAAWDFGGQSAFYTVHHLFLSRNGVYVLAFNIVALLKSPEAELTVLSFWLNSIYLHTKNAPIILVGTHCKGLNFSDLERVSNHIVRLPLLKKVVVIENQQGMLVFYPVDNSLKKRNKTNNEALKEVILKAAEEYLSPEYSAEIPLAWMYFMDHLTQTKDNYVLLEHIVAESQALGFRIEEVKDMIQFYHQTGTIVNFGQVTKKNNELLEKVILLNPHWLLKALACFLYEVETHGTKRFDYPQVSHSVTEYEENAILSKSLLDTFWAHYSVSERNFLLALNLDSLLASRYEFNLSTGADSVEETYLMIPGMLMKSTENLFQVLPPKEREIKMSIRFDNPIPKGVYERIICLFLNRSRGVEGSKAPSVFANISCFFFQEAVVYLIPDAQEFMIIIDEAWKRWILEIRNLSLECIRVMQSFFAEDTFVGKLFLHGGIKNDNVCESSIVRNALRRGSPAVVDIKRQTISTAHFKVFFPNEDDHREVNEHYDCFLAHDWGTERSGFATHELVVWIAKMLREQEIKVWLDQDNLRTTIDMGILNGLMGSRKVVVFATERYLQRAKDFNTNCAKEFNSAVKKDERDLILVLLEAGIWGTRNWRSSPVEYHLGHKKYIDFSTQQKIEENFDELCELIMNKK